MTIQIRTIKTYILLYKLTKQVNYLIQARKLASELKDKQASDLTVFILKQLDA
jgi:hypothetical protein